MGILTSGTEMLKNRPDFGLIGRGEELSKMINILGRKFAHNVLLTGQGGVGCSALCLGLQEAKSDPNTPFDVLHKRMWWLDSDGLFSDPEKTQERFDKLMRTVSSTGDKDTILVIEDTRNFIESATNSGNGNFINDLMRNIENEKFQVIFEVKDINLDFVLNCHSSMKEQFTVLEINPPSNDKLEAIVKGTSIKLKNHHGISISNEAVDQAIYLTTTYPGKERSLMRSQPEASLTLLDRALATYKNVNHSNPKDLRDAKEAYEADPSNTYLQHNLLEEEQKVKAKRDVMAAACAAQSTGEQHLNLLEAELAELQSNKDPDASFLSSSREEMELAQQIAETKAIIKESSAKFESLTKEVNAGLELSSDDVFKEFSRLSGIPFDKLNEDESEKLLSLPVELKKKIFGQDHVIDQMSDALLTARTPGLKERGKPDAAFMFCGSSGVGKTEFAKQLARILKDDESAMLRFDMSEYSEKNNVTSLIGAPPGYAGFEQGGILTNAVRKNPNAIILFDEIEKADVSIFDIFLQVLDDGRLTDTQGRTVSFEHTILIFTTNTGAEHLLNEELTFEEQFNNTLEELSKEYRAEFLNRFGGRENIVAFKALPKEVIHFITRGQLDKVNRNLANADISLTISMDDENISNLCDHMYKPERGARGIDGVFRTNVYPKLAKIIKAGDIIANVTVIFNDGKFNLSTTTNT